MRYLVLALAVLTSIPFEGVAHRGVAFRLVPLPGVVLQIPVEIPICIHIDWAARRPARPAPGTTLA